MTYNVSDGHVKPCYTITLTVIHSVLLLLRDFIVML